MFYILQSLPHAPAPRPYPMPPGDSKNPSDPTYLVTFSNCVFERNTAVCTGVDCDTDNHDGDGGAVHIKNADEDPDNVRIDVCV